MFQNSSYYILPLSVKSCETVVNSLDSILWERIPSEKRVCNYLFEYVSWVIKSEDSCKIYSLKKPKDLPVYFFEKELESDSNPTLDAVTLYLFETGVAFLEYYVNYHDMSEKDIIQFAYYFKSTSRADGSRYNLEGKKSLLTISKELIPEDGCGVEFFFSNNSLYKCQTLCYHMIKTDYQSEYERDRLLFYLKRSYSIDFAYDTHNDCGKYDMVYAPYDYMVFGGSQEGVVALFRKTDIYFMEKLFPEQLKNDYHYMYLILLNQRFSEIKYVEEIALTEDAVDLVESISRKIVHLKTRYSFHVVSDDYIYQNLYSKMYDIFDIDKLFLDIEENGDRLALAQSNDSADREKKTNDFLWYISVLAVFSAITDLASYIDRMNRFSIISTVVSAVLVFALLGFGLYRTLRKPKRSRNNKK